MTQVVQITKRPTVVFAAENLETGEEALILTTPIPVRGNAAVIQIGSRWDDTHQGRGQG